MILEGIIKRIYKKIAFINLVTIISEMFREFIFSSQLNVMVHAKISRTAFINYYLFNYIFLLL